MIINLKERPHFIPTLAAWHYVQWGYLNPGVSLETRIEKMQKYLGDEPIPSTYLWVDEDDLIGSAALVKSDMDTHPELTPWLASVYVKLEGRGSGVGAALVNHIVQKAREQNLKELFLFTPDREIFYAKLGWHTFAKEEYLGSEVTLMKIKL
jgi:N-acetylglutamate synthase-like GNAT family acetyltransferase